MLAQRKMVAAGLAAGLLGGGAAGLLLGNSPLSGATGAAVVQDDPTTTEDPAAAPETPAQAPDWSQRAAERLAETLAPLVDNGTIDQAQADAVIAAIADAMPEGPRGGRGLGRGPLNVKAAADAIGISVQELVDAVAQGSTIAEVATDAGVDPQVVIDALVADARQRLADRVAEGDLTQEEADQKLAELTERATEMVNDSTPIGPLGGHRGEGHGGFGPPPDGSPEGDSGD
ncbi:MAG: hypothetical protein ACK5O2_09005 [Microthrixaceae bacterium]